MSPDTDIFTLYREFTDALTEILRRKCRWPSTPWPARKGTRCRQETSRVQRTCIYFLAVETAFKNWETMQNAGR